MKKTARLLFLTLFLLSNILSPLARAETVDINATVPANSTDFSAELITTTTGDVFPQDTTLSYELTYGSSLSYSSTVIVEASWSQGTIQGDPSPTIELLDYVIGSASDGYNSTPPVVDTLNRKITWTITSLPGNTQNQTVTFDLKTKDMYSGSEVVDFTVSGRILGPGTATPSSSVTQSYLYDISLAPTPTPTPLPTATPTAEPTSPPAVSTGNPTPSPTLSPTPTPTRINTFSTIAVRTVDASEATIFVTTTKSTSLQLFYGTSPTTMNQIITSSEKPTHLLTLPNLRPQTKYFFYVVANDATGISTSDIFTFTTAQISNFLPPIPTSIILTAGSVVLYNSGDTAQPEPFFLMLPTSTEFNLRLGISNTDQLISVSFLGRKNLVSNDVLSVTTTELQSGFNQGRFRTTDSPTEFDVYVRIETSEGAVSEVLIGSIKVVRPFTIINKRTQEPIEKGEVILSIWNEREKRYLYNTSNVLPSDTLHSDVRGIVPLILPNGKYRAEVTAFGFQPQTVDFTIGKEEDAGYPTVAMNESGINFFTIISYIALLSGNFISKFGNTLADTTNSVRLYHLLAATSLLALSIITLVSFFSRSKLTPAHLPIFLLYHFTKNHHSETLSVSGIVVDHETTHPLSHANVYLFDEHSDKIIAHSVSSLQGKYHFTNIPVGTYRISVLKTGFHPFVIHRTLTQNDTSQLHLAISHKEIPFPLHQKVLHLAEGFFSSTFEAWLLLSFLLLALVGMSIGWEKIVGFLAIALFNLTMWSVHRSNVTKS